MTKFKDLLRFDLGYMILNNSNYGEQIDDENDSWEDGGDETRRSRMDPSDMTEDSDKISSLLSNILYESREISALWPRNSHSCFLSVEISPFFNFY